MAIETRETPTGLAAGTARLDDRARWAVLGAVLPRSRGRPHALSALRGAPLAALLLVFVGACGGGSAQKPPSLSGWLSADPAKQTAVLTLRAGEGSIPGYGFNGYSRGQVLVEIPTGWRILVRCKNVASSVRHSCAIVDNSVSTVPAFPGAATPDPMVGLAPGLSASFSFVAGRAGVYRIACLVDDHEGGDGMWDVLRVGGTRRPAVLLLRRRP